MAYKAFRNIAAVLLLTPLLASAQAYKEGEHYRALAEPQPVAGDAVVVKEFFSYACPHCYSFESYLEAWSEDLPGYVDFQRVPAVFGAGQKVLASAYYAAESLDVLDKVHLPIFKALHEERKRLNSPDKLADVVAEHGVDRQEFLDAMDSFQVDANVRKAMQEIREYRVQGVPSVAVNGKYITSGSMVGTYPGALEVIDHLIEKEHQGMTKKKADSAQTEND